MRRRGFSRSLAFAALAAAGAVPWSLLASPIVGGRFAVAIYLVGAAAAFVAGLAPDLARRLAAFAAAAVAGAAVAIVARSTGELAAGLALVVAAARIAVLDRALTPRTLAVEMLLALAGLALARFLAGPSPIGLALAIWGFFLVQSVDALVGGLEARSARRDPFDEACARARALLDDARPRAQPATRAAMSSVRR